MNRLFDVAIIGGGPAGSAAGSLLAKMGRTVVILEKEKFPRFRVGESMLPRSLDILERIGVKEKIDQAGFIVKYGGEIVSACGDKTVRYYFRNGRKAKRQTAYQVLRSKFDDILLEHARETGCEVRQETRVDTVEFSEDAATLIQGDRTRVRAKYIVDCSGRNNLIGNRYGLKQPISNLKKYSVFAYYENVDRLDGEEGTLTRMIRAKDLWIWMIPLSGGLTSIGIVMDLEKFQA
ncbi:MAG: tryptophan 7-halogenase, partial [Verrucomicrobia bacterium]|nr:tryptophan 7-halogenase [Verrucomicrobiota bacterium]